MTKSALISALNGFITAVVTNAKHRSADGQIVNELYPEAVTDTQATTARITKGTSPQAANVLYSLTTWKQGSTVHIRGFFNFQGGASNQFTMATINSSEFMPKTSQFVAGINKSGQVIEVFIADSGEIDLNNSTSSTQNFYIDASYPNE